ncbi:MAG: electron transport complex subunit RsxG [Gammaproteobacteria bacterium]|nr:electron transport complex subunit RsxG [Gammaproteobacteria bacterium]MBU1602788.1 electron transport complex subunit RsxG [Gammaproteobacteria bacterium]MBU2432460.1 electron transport complex subunit RsxG [Gammaproteobacteria bacterium]MBU2448997.1 electron transport complex subunit RsxG [Gammaproteobacteria bacterium]
MNLDAIRDKLAYQPLLLGVVALIASGALAVVSDATGPAIAAAEAKDLRDSLSEVLPVGLADNDFLKDTVDLKKDGKTVTVYRARQGSEIKAALFKVAERGYGGDIQVLMAVDMAGRTLGVRVLKHTETPGLGDKIEAKKDDWVLAFNGKSLGDPAPDKWAVKKDNGVFDQFAGATITPRAVVKAVKGGLEFFVARKQEITG